MKLIKILIIFMLLSSCLFAKTRYKTFWSIEEAIDFVAQQYPVLDDTIGQYVFWSSHKIVAIPVCIKEGGIVKCKFVVYWVESDSKPNP